MDNIEIIPSIALDVEGEPTLKKRTRLRIRPRVSLQKWALLQNETFPELYYKSIKEMIKDRKTHFLKMSQIMMLIDKSGTMTPIGRVRKRSRDERLIHFPQVTEKKFGESSTETDSDAVVHQPKVRRKSIRISRKKSTSYVSDSIPPLALESSSLESQAI